MRDPSVWAYQSPVPHDILVASGVPEVFTFSQPTENQATIDYLCLWEHRYVVNGYLLGDGVLGVFPRQHPVRRDLFARRTVITGVAGVGFDGNFANYRYAKLNVTYQQITGQNPNGDNTAFITVDTEGSSEFMTIPGRELKWNIGGGNPLDGKSLSEPQSISVPKKTHKISVHQWRFPPFAAFDTKAGGINDDVLRWTSGRTVAAEHMLFEGWHESYDITIQGILTYKIDLTFMEKSRSWNKFPGPDGAFHDVTPKPYTGTQLGPIFP